MRGVRGAVALCLLVLVASSCGNQDPAPDPTVPPPSAPAPTPGAADSSSAPATPPPVRAARPGELTKGRLQHTVRASGLTVRIDYRPDTAVASWTAEGTNPVQLSVTVRNDRRPEQKVFLTRATMRFALSDGAEDIPGPDPLVDTANITPGYLATSPYSYVQSFAIPSLDVSARELRIEVKLELVSLVDAKAKDYTKQTVTDTVRATLPG